MLAFGFLASQEVKDAGVGNLGLQDRKHSAISTTSFLTSGLTERMALRWVQKYIHLFGGDSSKVTVSVRTPFNTESADISKLGRKCWVNLSITPNVDERWEHRRAVSCGIYAVWVTPARW